MATQNGFAESLVIRVTPTGASPPLLESEELPRLHAPRARAVETAAVMAIDRRRDVLRVMRGIVGLPLWAALAALDNVVSEISRALFH
jgi:hypothetical protein